MTLLICGDDLSRVDRAATLAQLSRMQLDDGRFLCSAVGGDADLRFVYTAVATCALLGDRDFASIPRIDAAVAFVLACQTYEGGFALQPHAEAHGAGTYLAVAVLTLTGRLDRLSATARTRLVRWAVHRQGTEGYTGRTNKAPDSCYSLWLGAALQMLGVEQYTLPTANCAHLALCADHKRGGFGKEKHQRADLLHSYMATAGLSLMQAIAKQEQPELNGDIPQSPLWSYPVQRFDVVLGLPADRLPRHLADDSMR